MAPNFAALDKILSRAVDTDLGELLRFTPQGKADNWGNAASTSRTVIECTGTFLDGDTEILFTDGDRRMSKFNGRTSSQIATASVDRSYFSDGMEPRQGDFVETIDQLPIRKFEIVDAYPDGYSRWLFRLVPA
jgi:hypothetical protein